MNRESGGEGDGDVEGNVDIDEQGSGEDYGDVEGEWWGGCR